jgi:hypothetical protein
MKTARFSLIAALAFALCGSLAGLACPRTEASTTDYARIQELAHRLDRGANRLMPAVEQSPRGRDWKNFAEEAGKFAFHAHDASSPLARDEAHWMQVYFHRAEIGSAPGLDELTELRADLAELGRLMGAP